MKLKQAHFLHLPFSNKRKLRYPFGAFRAHPAVHLFITLLFGGVAYGLMELCWRGFTHPSMVLTGGICFALILEVNRRFPEMPLILRSALCAVSITAVEFAVGILVNRVLSLSVWDYSDEWLNLFGQICPLYSCLWFLLSLPVSFLISRKTKRASLEPSFSDVAAVSLPDGTENVS